MRRTLPILALVGLPAAALVVALSWPAFVPAQLGKAGVARARTVDPRLPISRVALFTSGVGYFQRDGEIDGSTSVELAFPVGDVNDLLKSLVLRDLSGGQIRAVGYDSYDPIDKTLRNFAVNLSDNPGYGQVLNQARGEKVEVTWRPSDRPANAVHGTIMGVEKQKQPIGRDAVLEVELLNLWSAEGMRSLKLSQIGQVRFVNSAIDSEVKRALDVLARGHDRQKKTLSLSFSGKGKRQVQVGYVVEHPIWKTSYRLVLSGQKKAFLQGWAMVENPTGEDWNNVRVQLVSGRPISFRMDLYQPLYVDRPLVELEQFAAVRPRAYAGEILQGRRGKKEKEEEEEEEKEKMKEKVSPKPPMEKSSKQRRAGLAADDLAGSVRTAATGTKLGEAFQYAIKEPLTLPRQKSALVPIVTADLEATRVSIYHEKVQVAHPLLGLKLKNTTGLHLMQGPITVFSEGSYAGDALTRDLQPNEERLLSYAVDQAVEVKAEAKKAPDRLVAIRINKGTLQRTYTLRETKTYQLKNRADQDRLVIVEHPSRAPDYTVIAPAQTPKGSRDVYRFEVKVPKGESVPFQVVEEREQLHQVVLTNADTDTLAVLLQGPASPGLKAAVQKAVELKDKLATTQRDSDQVKRRLSTISEDQARQRENMKVIPQTEPVYKKYLDKFLAQEAQIEKLRAEQERLQLTADRQRQEYERYVMNLTVNATVKE